MTDHYPLEGGCACGGVRYQVNRPPMFVHCCHCRWCQRETGSAFAINALIEAEEIVVTAGTPDPVKTPSESGKGQIITRCRVCRVALWSNYAEAGAPIRFLRVGTLDNPDRIAPDVHIYIDSKQPWVTLPPDVPAFGEFYDSRETWPEESLDRARACYRAAKTKNTD